MKPTVSQIVAAPASGQPGTTTAPRRLLAAVMLAAATSFAMACSAFTGARSYGPSPITTSSAPPRRGAARS